MLDRVDIHIETPRVDYEKLSGDWVGKSSAAMGARVQTARNIQQLQFTNSQSDMICNIDIRFANIIMLC